MLRLFAPFCRNGLIDELRELRIGPDEPAAMRDAIRFIIEFFRNDYRGSIGVLSTSQIISIGVVAAGVVFYLVMNFRNCKGVTP